jgi:hypothetical protein
VVVGAFQISFRDNWYLCWLWKTLTVTVVSLGVVEKLRLVVRVLIYSISPHAVAENLCKNR